ncbi:unnamed protein product [Musa acuminata subsp. malaccensis]|uniref:(wild Malaysian banana) hypothetical protein n=1 Tax=Musa acuminata subsp. malaccensis TaxID=214687 RepID=A0A804L8M8_MUSAM|nr:PREDICTED: uncharacterized protein ECU03_1610-like [Musa acuminata subsp. malaccensis]CAG1864799.1 unnamed protein product [Musa acuminata subsp. malaccensis]
MVAMFVGGRTGMCSNMLEAIPNPSLPARPTSLRPTSFCFQSARGSSQAFKRAGDYGGVVDRNAIKAKEYVEKVEAMGDRTKEAASSMTEAAKEKVKEKADSVAARVESADAARENAKEGVTKAKDETKSIVEKAKDKTEEAAAAVGEKAKQTMQYAWEAAKETTQKIKETVVGKDV